MGVDIDDLQNRERTIHANWWRWRPTVELLRDAGLFDDGRLDLMSDGHGEFTEEEAHQIGEVLRRTLATLQTDERVRLDGTKTNEPDDGTFYRDPEEQYRNYSVDYDWLARFVEFCMESGGLYVC